MSSDGCKSDGKLMSTAGKAGALALMADDQDAQLLALNSIDQRKRKAFERITATLPGNGRAKTGVFQQQLDHPIQFTRKACRNGYPSVLKVVILCDYDI